MLPDPLAILAAWPQFVAWRLDWLEDRQAWAKVPYSPTTGRKASSTDPSHWGSYDQAKAFADANGMAGVGFVFTERDPFFFIDIDKALGPSGWSILAQELCARFAGAAVEVSQSGTGLHIIGRYSALGEHRSKNVPLGLELYTKERFVALTGTSAMGSADTLHDAALTAVIAQYFTREIEAGQQLGWTTEADPEWIGPADDEELIRLALRSQSTTSAASAFGGVDDKVSFADLWNANADVLARKWPGTSGPYDASSADQSLANLLAFWTGRNCERMERLMRSSALVRQKWEDRPDYLETTILKAAQSVKNVYKSRAATALASAAAPAVVTGRENGYIADHYFQMQHFEGCVYVAGPHRILTPRGELLDQGRFDAMYGGFEFVLSPDGKKSTTSAWTAFTQSQTFTPSRADRLCFRPEAGVGGVITDSGKRLANAYFPAEVDMLDGDASPMVNHIRKMLPHGDDCEMLLSYMASVVQNPGMKAQWWPVVQGAQGNFKSFLLLIMSHAVGSHYSHMPNMKKMVKGDSNFNGWIDRKLFLGLDEVYAADRREFFEGFKTTVTNRTLAIEGKGLEEVTGDNRANGMIVTNHQDGVPISGENRRYAAFFCAQQTPEDMLRDGMTPEYITNLKDWLLGLGPYAAYGVNYGIKVMANYLKTRQIEARFDPAQLSIRCPETTTTASAIIAGRGRVEQEVLEAIEEGQPGFCGDWISSIKLDELLERRKFSLPRNKRRDMLRGLGYDWHPALESLNGRVNNIVQPDNGKPRLFCKIESISWKNLTEPAAVASAYSKAQSVGLSEKNAAAFGG